MFEILKLFRFYILWWQILRCYTSHSQYFIKTVTSLTYYSQNSKPGSISSLDLEWENEGLYFGLSSDFKVYDTYSIKGIVNLKINLLW